MENKDETLAYEVISFVTDELFVDNVKNDFAKAIETNDPSKLNSKLKTVYSALVDKRIKELHGLLKDETYRISVLKEYAQKQRSKA